MYFTPIFRRLSIWGRIFNAFNNVLSPLGGKMHRLLIIRNSENGSETILDDACNLLYGCCGHSCDCAAPPIWINKIKNKAIVWENR
jgi:hypothetical protein